MSDPLVDMVEQARAELLKRHGGFEGVLKHLQEMDRQRILKTKRRKKPARRAKGTTRA